MIKQLQRRFIRIAVVALTVAMVLVVGIVNVASWITVRGELYNTLSLITQATLPDGTGSEREAAPPLRPPNRTGQKAEKTEDEDTEKTTEEERKEREARFRRFWERFQERNMHFRNMVSESRWFSALVTSEGEFRGLLMNQMENLEEDSAKALVRQALESGRTEGFLQDCLFSIRALQNGNREVVLLSCETRLSSVRNLVLISAIACAGGILLAWVLVTLASRKAVAPTIRNMEQQKKFITNASHELKTPLTVISTNMELLEMETEDNPWVRSTLKQTDILRRLVDELIYLSRMEEEHPPLSPEKLDPAALLEETAEPFVSMAEYSGREMTVEAEKGLQMTGDRASLQRLMSTLCDNAVRYASEGPIRVEIRGEGKNHILLRTANPVAEPLTREQCEQLFNRFYRVDSSRNKEKQNGFGIGLAIASAIAEKHGGRISAAMEGNCLVFSCLLPREARIQG